ncbi:LOW QUALITY PROTEIN: mis18-binding protein 1-like [Argopecten irradians]|uniref:LOW QUALITY PROTEIN: mis18-binding protein 1-like n=1 Tax=Argopecten irradians TaxID=31199 RepID=UPI0037186C99
MSHNRSHIVCSSMMHSDEPSEHFIENAFDRLYERSPLPELLQSHYGSSPRKRFHGQGNASPADRCNQMYASLKKTRKSDVSYSHSDHGASFSVNNSSSAGYARNSPHLNRSSDMSSGNLFRKPVQRWVDTRFSRDVNRPSDRDYSSEYLERPGDGDKRDNFGREFTNGINEVSFRKQNFREDDEENFETTERRPYFDDRQYSRSSDQQEWRYQTEHEDHLGNQGDKCKPDWDRLHGNNQHVSPVIPFQGGGRKNTQGPVRDQAHSSYHMLGSKEKIYEKERRVHEFHEVDNCESDLERDNVIPGYGEADYGGGESDGSASDIDLIPSENHHITHHLDNHNNIVKNPGVILRQKLQSVSCQGTDTETPQNYPGSSVMDDQEISIQDQVDKESSGRKVDRAGSTTGEDSGEMGNDVEEDSMEETVLDEAAKGTIRDDISEDKIEDGTTEDTIDNDAMEDTLEDVTEDKIEDEQDKIEKENQRSKVTNKEMRMLYEWIIKPVPSAKGVCVEGKQSDSANEEFWKSSVIKERIDRTTVQTSSGTLYKLIGDIDKIYTLEEGFSVKLVNAFLYGFPKNWKKLIEDHFNEIEELSETEEDRRSETEEHCEQVKPVHQTPKVKKNASVVKNLSTKNDKKFLSPGNVRRTQDDVNLESMICTPEGQFVDLKNLKKTRSGRMVKPPLFWWMGQQIVTDSDKVEVSTATSHAKEHIQGIAHIYSGSKGKGQQKASLNRSYNTKKTKLNKAMNKTIGSIVEVDSSLRKPPSNKLHRSASNKSTNSETGKSNQKFGRSRKARKSANKSKNVTDEDSCSQCSDSENLDPIQTIENTLQRHKNSRLKHKSRKDKCYDDSDSTSKKGESTISDVFSISSDEDTVRRGKQKSSKRQEKRTRKNTSRVKDPSIGERSQSDISSDEKQRSDKEKQTENMFQGDAKTDVRMTRSRISAGLVDPSSLVSQTNQTQRKATRSRSRSQDSEPARSKSQTNKIGLNRQSIQGDISSDSDNSEVQNKKSTLTRKSRISKKAKTILDYSSSEDYVPDYKKSRKQKASKKRSKSQNLSADSDNDFTETPVTVVKNRTMSRLQDKKTQSSNAVDIWSNKEARCLRHSVASIKTDHPDFWNLVQQKVQSKTIEQCQEQHWRDCEKKEQKKKDQSKTKPVVNNDKVKLTAARGTMKRKQQLRSLMEEYDKGHEDDLCDGTPFRSRLKSKVPRLGGANEDEDEDDLFNEIKKMNPNLTNRIHTPLPHFHIEPVSQKKTPFNPLISPSEPANRNEMDRYIHRVMKRRRLGDKHKGNTDMLKTPVNKPKSSYNEDKVPTPTKKLFAVTPGNVNSLLMSEEKLDSDNHVNSDEESDYYWSDKDN